MTKSITINLAGRDYDIKEYTLGQIEELYLTVSAPVIGTDDNKAFMERNRAVLRIALSDYPEITDEALKKMRLGTIDKVRDAASAILDFSGLVKTKTAAAVRAEIEALQVQLKMLEAAEAASASTANGAASVGEVQARAA